MTQEKWKSYLDMANQPDSLTSEDNRRRAEALYFTVFATDGWDKTKKLLVLGCGDGYEVSLLKEAGWEDVKGITFYDGEYENAKKMGFSGIVVQGDIHEMPFGDEEFDYIISKETLEHMISPFIALCEVTRVMKKEARFVHYIPEGEAKQSDWYHYTCAPAWLWKDLMTKAGLNVSSVKTHIEQNCYEGYKI